jgi:predicted metalloprotease with PDZ domain
MRRSWKRAALSGLFTMAIAAAPAIGAAKQMSAQRTQAPETPPAALPGEGGQNAWLGVHLQDITPDLASALKLKSERGALVRQVEKGSPAEKAGIENGDVIVEVAKRAVSEPADVVSAVSSLAPGESARVKVIRLGRTRTMTARLAERPSGFGETPLAGAPEAPEPPDAPQAPAPGEPGSAPDARVHSQRAYLGIRIEELDDDLAKYFGVSGSRGVLITNVEEGSPSAEAGLRSGDVILSVDGHPVSRPADLVRRVLEKEPGDQITLVVLHERHEKTVSFEAGGAPAPSRGMRRAPYREREMRHDMRRGDRELRREMDRLREELDQLRGEIDRLRDEDR